MKLTRMCLAAGVGAVAMLAAAGNASAIVIESAAGNTNCTIYTGAGCTTEAISVHPLWQSNNPDGSGAVWVSYDDTGHTGSTLAPYNGSLENPLGTTIIMTIEETFSLLGSGFLSLKTWADDTANLYLNGVLQKPANFTQDICADGSIGCESDEFFLFETQLTAGNHTLTWEVFQFGEGQDNASNPFGLLYAGSVEVPEPGTLALLGMGLLGLGGAAMRRRRSA